ncbi:MAG: aspartyl protease family protein [Hyphomonadaceae bacterium]|nr:aspartyl protease family protein [Hyphomonadaceae bacterium]
MIRSLSVFIFAAFAAFAPARARAADCIATTDLPVASETAALEAAVGRTTGDRTGRVVIPVSVNGGGPYRFIVDTGANRSVLSQDLASTLGLTPIGVGEVHSVHDVTPAPLVEVNTLQYGPVELQSRPMPLLQGPVLAGQDGLLGVDGMAGRRLILDFRRRCIEISPAARAYRLGSNWTTVRGVLRFGHLVVLPGAIRDTEVNVLVDTGSDVTLANPALRNALAARAASMTDALTAARAYSAGAPIVLDDVVGLPTLELGDLTISDLVAYVGDFHIFELWGLQNEPTLLIGMDALRRTRAIAIDYERGTVSFRLQRGPGIIRMDTHGSRLQR